MQAMKRRCALAVLVGLIALTPTLALADPPTKVTIRNCAVHHVTVRAYNGDDSSRIRVSSGPKNLDGRLRINRSNDSAQATLTCHPSPRQCWIKFTCESGTPCNQLEKKLDHNGQYTFLVNGDKSIRLLNYISTTHDGCKEISN